MSTVPSGVPAANPPRLTKFGNLAIDWSRVYAVRVVGMNFHETHPNKVWIFADLAHVPVGEPAVRLENPDPSADNPLAMRAWEIAAADKRFQVFGTENQLAIDMSKVHAITVAPDRTKAQVFVELGDDRTATLPLNPVLADLILASIPTS